MSVKDGFWRIGAEFQVLSSICQYSEVCPTLERERDLVLVLERLEGADALLSESSEYLRDLVRHHQREVHLVVDPRVAAAPSCACAVAHLRRLLRLHLRGLGDHERAGEARPDRDDRQRVAGPRSRSSEMSVVICSTRACEPNSGRSCCAACCAFA